MVFKIAKLVSMTLYCEGSTIGSASFRKKATISAFSALYIFAISITLGPITFLSNWWHEKQAALLLLNNFFPSAISCSLGLNMTVVSSSFFESLPPHPINVMRSEERRVGKSVDFGGGRIISK